MSKKLKDSVLSGISFMRDKASKATATAIASTTAFFAEADLLKWTEELTKSAATIYDKALDKEYLATKIGGGNHRLFDGGHDLFSAWERAREAAKDDSFAQEVIGCITALWKDVTTTKGLPFATLDKASYDEWAEIIANWVPGLKKEYLCDILSFDAMEVFSTTLGAVAVVFVLKKDDQKRLAEILGSMGVVSITSANPIMGIVVTAVGAYAYVKEKKKIDKKAMATSASLAATSAVIFGALGLPILLEFAIVLVVATLLKKHIFNNEEAMLIIKQNIAALGERGFSSLQRLVSNVSQREKKVA